MTREEIINQVQAQIANSKGGLQSENPKFDFKFKWYDLAIKGKDYYEFLKDTSSMANTFGPSGLIVIGYDDSANAYNASKVSDSGFYESLNILGIISKNIVEPFDINFHEIEINSIILSVIEIPPSISKPHIVKEYKRWNKQGEILEANRIFVRKDTGTFPATKYDIDLMYYDKKNVAPDYQLFIDTLYLKIGDEYIGSPGRPSGKSELFIEFTIENTGLRPIAIETMSFNIMNQYEPIFELGYKNNLTNELIIHRGEIKYYHDLKFIYDLPYQPMAPNFKFDKHTEITATIILTNGKTLKVLVNKKYDT